MKFTIKKNILEQVVEFLGTYINVADTFLAFRYINLEVTNEKLIFTAASSTMSARKILNVDEVNIKVEEEGFALLNCKVVKNIIKNLSNNVSISKRGNIINISEGNTKYNLNTISDRYPTIEFGNVENKFQMNKNDFEEGIKNVAFAVGDPKNNSAISKAINMYANNNELRFCGTDSFRLSTYTVKISKNISFDISVDARNMKNMIIKDNNVKRINVFYTLNRFGIETEDTIIQSSLVDLAYHDIKRIFPTDITRNIVIQKNVLMDIINKTIFDSDNTGAKIELNFTSNLLTATYEEAEVGHSQASTDDFKLIGDPIELTFNSKHLREAIGVVEGELNIGINFLESIVLLLSENCPNNKQLITTIRRL
ncbi:DNA polymerase III subunit beta [Mycoplasma crocodyli]|uniref:DNA polymerase III, beta subunit n=1 Tax=Mycoplasma crocodyli (strain ATCC 51981 / MP145) TaxID=512564 RepID=D5E4J3_MYCCM|nr:DNA polymerase III subunit beta [Mycoplasma crocodyli]ADE19407.1 DNA polymerase III, beta subunit [Mycoplasma crocodyli MP145]